MANESRASGDDDDRGAGGKLLRRRRRRDAREITPYRRPEEEEERRRWWLSGLVVSAGRLLSKVFRSGGGEDESESDSSEGDDSLEVNHEDQMIEDQKVDFEPVAPNIPTKLVIEQMLQKENYTRGECNRLIEIIQSRVIASSIPDTHGDGISNGLPDVSLNNDVSYRGSFLEQVHTPEISHKAVMEAKKWVEEKRSAISSKAVHGSSSFKTAIFVTDEPGNASPVDMAKSYMHTLPPSSSPARTSGFRNPALRTCSKNIETSSTTDLKRKYDCMVASDDFDTTQRMHQKTSEDAPVSLAFRQSESSNKTVEHEYSQTLGSTDGKLPEVLPTSKSVAPEGTANFPLESIERITPLDSEDVAKTSLSLNNGVCTETDIVGSGHLMNSLKNISNANVGHEGTLSVLASESEVQVEVVSSLKEILISEKNLDLEETAFSNKSIDIDKPQETDLHSILMDQKCIVEDFMNAEPISMVPENDNPTLPGKDSGETIDVTKSGDSNLPEGSRQAKLEKEDNSSQPTSFTASEVLHTDAGASHDIVSGKETRSVRVSATAGGVSSIPSSSLAGFDAVDSSNATTNVKDGSPKSNGVTVPNNVADTSSDGNTNKKQKHTMRPPTRQSPRKAPSSISPRQAPPSTSPSRGRGKMRAMRGRRRGRGA